MIQFVVFIFVISHSKQFQVAVYDRIETFHFTFVGLFYSELMASWGEEKNLLRHRLHSEKFHTKTYGFFLLVFQLQIKTRRGRRFDNNSSDGTATTTPTAKHSTAVDGLPTDGSRREEDAPSDCQQQWAPSDAEHQRWIPKFASTLAAPWRRKAQQGESLKLKSQFSRFAQHWKADTAVCPRAIPLGEGD